VAESIQVYWEPLGTIPYTSTQFYHETLLYTNSSGQKFIATCGPSGSLPADATQSDTAQVISQAATGAATSYGQLDCWSGSTSDPNISGSLNLAKLLAPSNPVATVATGADLSSDWTKITSAEQQISAAHYNYSPMTLNSNSAANTALTAAGIAMPSDISAFGSHWSPAGTLILPTTFTAGSSNIAVSTTTDAQGNQVVTVSESTDQSMATVELNSVGSSGDIQWEAAGIVQGEAFTHTAADGSIDATITGDVGTLDFGSAKVTLTLADHSSATILGTAVTVIAGTGDTVHGDDLTIDLASNASLNVVGSGDTVNAATNDAVTLGGNGQNASDADVDLVQGSGATVSVLDESKVNVCGSNSTIDGGANDSIGAYGSNLTVNSTAGDAIWAGQNGQNSSDASTDLVQGSAVSVTIVDGSRANVCVSNATVNAGANDTFGAYGSNITVNSSTGDDVWVGMNGQNSSSADLVLGSAPTVNVADGSYVNVCLSNATITGGSNATFGAYGANLSVNGQATDSVWVGSNGTTGTADVVNLAGGTVAVADSSHVDVYGSPNTILVGNSDEVGGYSSSTSYTVNGTSSWVYGYVAGVQVNIYGDHSSDASYQFGDSTTLYGNSDQSDAMGSYESVYAQGGFGVGYLADNTDSFSSNGTTNTYSFGISPTYDHEAMGFAGSQAAVQATLASAANGTSDLGRALQEVNGAVQYNVQSMMSGWRFEHRVITWSIDGTQPSFSGHLGSPELTAVKNAFYAWAAASGLQFQQVGAGVAADIDIGWANFATQNSGVVGLTSVTTDAQGNAVHGVVKIENKGETAIVNGTYSGTDATLTQVLMHEIGHALGLGDNADSSSIENYFLGSSNASLTVRDAQAVQALYSDVVGNGVYVSDDVKAAASYMASFALTAGQGAVQLMGVHDHIAADGAVGAIGAANLVA
jgi:hypothetical protein